MCSHGVRFTFRRVTVTATRLHCRLGGQLALQLATALYKSDLFIISNQRLPLTVFSHPNRVVSGLCTSTFGALKRSEKREAVK